MTIKVKTAYALKYLMKLLQNVPIRIHLKHITYNVGTIKMTDTLLDYIIRQIHTYFSTINFFIFFILYYLCGFKIS